MSPSLSSSRTIPATNLVEPLSGLVAMLILVLGMIFVSASLARSAGPGVERAMTNLGNQIVWATVR